MTIGIDIRVLASGQISGVQQYTINLLSHLISLDKSIRYKLFYNGWKKQKLHWQFLDNYNVDLKSFSIPNRLLFTSSRFLNYPKIDQLLYGVDVFFSPHIFIAPISKNCKKVITVHDLGFEHFPEFLPRSGLFLHKFIFNPREQLERADKIIAVSKSTKNDLIKLYNIPEEKIEVIYSGVNQLSKPDFDRGAGEVKQKYNLPDNYILYLGTIEPRKNILGIVKAFEILKDCFGHPELNLVIAGQRGWISDELYKYISLSKYRNNIILTGFVPEEDKPYFYKSAKAFVYPSFFEGFGFQVLEAASLGVPVITSKISSLPEVIGSTSLMVDPYNPDELARAIKYILSNERISKTLSALGRLRASKFSWASCAQKTLETLTAPMPNLKGR